MINQKLVDNIRAHGIYTNTAEGKLRVLKDIGFRTGKKAEYAFISSCSPQQVPHAFRALKELFDHFQIDYTLLPKEYCCSWGPIGQPAVTAKNEGDTAKSKELAREFILENFKQAEVLGAKSIVLFCAACEPAYTNNAKETRLEIISYRELLNRYFKGGRLDLEIDYYAGCYRFRRRLTSEPVDLEPAVQLLNKIEGLKINYLDNNLCCYIPPHLDQLIPSLTTSTLVTICTGCYHNLRNKLKDRGDYQVKMLPEILLEAVRAR